MATLRFTEGSSQPPTFAGTPGQLLPNVVDGLANTRPQSLYAMIPRSFTTYDEGFRKVTYRRLANAINGVAWFLTEQLGKDALPQVLAYVGPNDIGYIVYILGAVKAGHAILAVGPRNTKADHASLFAASGCTTLLTLPPPYSPTVSTIQEAVGEKLRILHASTIFELLDKEPEHFPYFEDVQGPNR